MVNLKEKATTALVTVKKKSMKKILSAVCAASMAASALTVNAFASSEGGTVDYSSLSTSITDALKTIVSNCIDIAVAVIPIGVGLIGIGKMWDVARKFFNKLSGKLLTEAFGIMLDKLDPSHILYFTRSVVKFDCSNITVVRLPFMRSKGGDYNG